ncbi:MAG: HAMP domain-containing histidine kinase [bacterium]|nr:HAMP domain-containing histidine kinase [bacterium]
MTHLLRSRIFRYGVAYAGLFFISTLLVLSLLYFFAFKISAGKVEDRLEQEAAWLQEIMSGCTEMEDIQRLNYHIADHPGNQGIYLLLNSEKKRLAGNLDLIPEVDLKPGQCLTFWHQDQPNDTGAGLHILATGVLLDNGRHLLVGHNYQAIDQIKKELRGAAIWALAISGVMGVLVAFFLARRLAWRLEKINRTSREILEGNLETRMPNTGSGDEFDHLSTNLNRMLDRIFYLMESVRGVTDNIAHDLRNPLSRMRNRMDVALLSDRPCEEYKDILVETVEDTDRMLATFNSLLTIARLESGAERDDFETVDLEKLVSNTAEFYLPVVEENGQKLSWSAHGNDMQIRGNVGLLTQALVNLLDNAVKYSPEGSTIELLAKSENNLLFLEVVDNGPGIPAHFREKAMHRFTRLDESRSKQGQGLGLSLVQVVTQMHGGEIHLADAKPGLRVVLQFHI